MLSVRDLCENSIGRDSGMINLHIFFKLYGLILAAYFSSISTYLIITLF